MIVVYDSEGNNLLQKVTRMWCFVGCDTTTGKYSTFYDGYPFDWDKDYSGSLRDGVQYLLDADMTVAHNLTGYDRPAIEKLFNVKFTKPYEDTLILSRLSNPDRLGGHSIKAWGKFFGGEQKVEHEDWTQFSEDMLKRCISDVRLNVKVYNYLKKEMGRE